MKRFSISSVKSRLTKKKAKKWLAGFWKEWRVTIFIIVFVIIPIKSSLADWNWVPTGSMNPTILEGDLIFINKAAYGLRVPLTMWRLAKWGNPKRGEIVVCFSPEEDRTRLVKRVIGLPGDEISMSGGRLYINGEAIEYGHIDPDFKESLPSRFQDKYLFAVEQLGEHSHPVAGYPLVKAVRDLPSFTIPDGKYFLMGDNRDLSRDSRVFGFVDRNLIVGHAKGIIVSFDKADKYQPIFRRFFSSLE